MNRRFTTPDFADLPERFRTNLINSLSGYKGVALCGTTDGNGLHNLSVISSVFHVGANPPLVGMLIRPHTVPRHTLENLRATGAYTLNSLIPSIMRQAHQSSASYEREVSEFDATGLTPLVGTVHPAPYVAESPIRIGLKPVEEVVLASNGCILVVGEIIELELPADVIENDGFIRHDLLHTLAATGLDAYHTAQPLARMTYPKPDPVDGGTHPIRLTSFSGPSASGDGFSFPG